MDSITANVPESIRIEAKARALAVLGSEPGCVSLIRPEDLETAALFIPVVSIIKPSREDFYDPIPKVGIMAKPPLMNLIREKAGVEITRTDTAKRGEWIWHAHAYGQKRMPDGTMAPDDAAYEFDAEKRAEMDILRKPDDYKTETSKRLHLLEVAKFGEQRAVTGAQHALICKMAKVARAFRTPEELMRGMKVLRIDRNVNGVLADPGMRQAVLGQFLGAKEAVFGPQPAPLGIEMKDDAAPRTVDADTGEMVEKPATFDDDLPWEDEKPEPSALDAAKDALRAYLDQNMSPKAVLEIRAALNDNAATLPQINSLVDRCAAWIQKRAEKRGAA